VGARPILSGVVSTRIGSTFAVKHEAESACRREKIFGERAKLKRKTTLERKRYNSKMTSRVEITLKYDVKFVAFLLRTRSRVPQWNWHRNT
jgi:hypothetical protein